MTFNTEATDDFLLKGTRMTGNPTEKRTVILIIGNEILSGRVQDTNSHFLCKKLYELGVKVCRIVTIPDDETIIANEIKSLTDRFDIVIVAGGVGPTHDDVTMESIARGLNRPLFTEPILEKLIRDYCGDEFDPCWLKMARVPEGTELVGTGKLTFPVIKIENIYIFPGIPEILESKFVGIQEEFKSSPYFREEIEVTANEAQLVPILNSVVKKFPDVQIGSYPSSRQARQTVRLSLESKAKARVEEALTFLTSLMKMHDLS
jgi:FAD synthetase